MGTRAGKAREDIEVTDMLDSILAIHFCIIIGATLHGVLISMNFELPLFVTCLLAELIITNALVIPLFLKLI